jgi:hypothetical protein
MMERVTVTQAGITENQSQVISKAIQDADFRAELLKDPKGAVSKLGVNIPDVVDLEVLEESPTKAYLVLPLAPTAMSEESNGDVQGYWWWNDDAAKNDVQGFWQGWDWDGWQWE